MLFRSYKTRNRGRRVEDWQGAGLNDPIVPILAQLPNRQERAFTSDEIYGYQPTEREAGFFAPQRVGSWDELDLAGKIGRATDASADLSEAGLGWKAVHAISKVVQSTLGGAAVGGIGGAGIGAAAGLVTGPGAAVASAAGGTVGAIGGGVYGLASGIVEAASGKQLPGYAEAMAAFNKGAEKIEQGLGTAAVFRERTLRGYGRGINRANQENANFKDRLLLTIQEMGAEWARGKEEIGDIWEASKQSYEVGLGNAGDLWGDFLTAMMFNSRRDYQPEGIFTGIGETYRWNEGLPGKRKVDENTRGITGLETLIQMRKNMREQGLTDDQINEIQTRIVQLSTGYSGVQTDQIVQSIVDPMNFLNLGAGAILDKIADATGDAAMKAAVKANRGNAFIDALPMYADDIATAATGLNKSGGLTQILSTYADIVKTINVDELTSFQRRLAGIADDGVLKQFAKGDYSGRMGWLKRWVDLTPESKVIGIDGMTSNFLRTMLADAEPEQIRSLLRQAAGLEEIAADSPYRDFFNSAEVRTIRPGLQNVLNDDSSLAALNSYELSVRPRQELERIARELEIRPDEVVEMYETKRNLFDTLVQTIQNADGTEIDLDAAHRTVDYFTGENAIPYQKEALRYRIVSQITDRLGDQLIQKYDIQPDPFIYRIGDTIKQAQSLFLLGTSPTFFVNNVVRSEEHTSELQSQY